uniref:Uncharacterized protein n=1 Tax=Nelumbo nucifera TaxID=4432 RepID=A0A822ZVG0_NELNU|nr:TPA_asm: hypothetical protein HUJ06_017216 [Nelumbo nucifera]
MMNSPQKQQCNHDSLCTLSWRVWLNIDILQ